MFCFVFVKGAGLLGREEEGKRKEGWIQFYSPEALSTFHFSESIFCQLLSLEEIFDGQSSFLKILDLIMLLTGLCMFEHVKVFSC